MQIERFNGPAERRQYPTAKAMIADAAIEAEKPETKKLTLHFPRPKMTIPGKRRPK